MSNLENFSSFEEMRNDEQIKAMVYRASEKYSRYLDPQDLESEIGYTLFRVWRLHNGKRGKVSTYLYNSLNNNLRKLCEKTKSEGKKRSVNDDVFMDYRSNNPSINEILDGLKSSEKELVFDRVVNGKTFTELSKKHNTTLYKIMKKYDNCIEKLKN